MCVCPKVKQYKNVKKCDGILLTMMIRRYESLQKLKKNTQSTESEMQSAQVKSTQAFCQLINQTSTAWRGCCCYTCTLGKRAFVKNTLWHGKLSSTGFVPGGLARWLGLKQSKVSFFDTFSSQLLSSSPSSQHHQRCCRSHKIYMLAGIPTYISLLSHELWNLTICCRPNGKWILAQTQKSSVSGGPLNKASRLTWLDFTNDQKIFFQTKLQKVNCVLNNSLCILSFHKKVVTGKTKNWWWWWWWWLWS